MSVLYELYESIRANKAKFDERTEYIVLSAPHYPKHFVGLDAQGRACILLTTTDSPRSPLAPIRLTSFEAHFDVACVVKEPSGTVSSTRFSVLRCTTEDQSIAQYFFAVGELLFKMLDYPSTSASTCKAVGRLASIFQRIQDPPTRSALGLFGELAIIYFCRDPRSCLEAWRADPRALFDFAYGRARLEVKTTTSRTRRHSFTYDQCNETGSEVIAASIITDKMSTGTKLSDLIADIESKLGGNTELLVKLYETVALTLGSQVSERDGFGFDLEMARRSARFFRVDEIPAIRGPLPPGVTDVSFRSDLSNSTPLSKAGILDLHPDCQALFPESA